MYPGVKEQTEVMVDLPRFYHLLISLDIAVSGLCHSRYCQSCIHIPALHYTATNLCEVGRVLLLDISMVHR